MRHAGHIAEQAYWSGSSSTARAFPIHIVGPPDLTARRSTGEFHHHGRAEGEICSLFPMATAGRYLARVIAVGRIGCSST